MSEIQTRKRQIITDSVDVYVTLALITLFVFLSLRFLSPFISILLWAVIMAVALHPLLTGLQSRLRCSAGLAATIIGFLGLFILLIPAFMIGQSIIESLASGAEIVRQGQVSIPAANPAVQDWPLIGNWLYNQWDGAHTDIKATLVQFAPQLEKLALFMLNMAAGLAAGVFQFALSVIFAAVFLTYSASLSVRLGQMANRVSSHRGRVFVDMAGSTIRNVSRGILGVALFQGGLASIGMFMVGLPFAGFLAAACVAASIVQVPILIIVPTIIYVWSVETTLVAIIYTAYMVPVLLSDNVLKPILMARGLETPMIVILIGVIGGTMVSGLMGLFIGPVVLALFYKMVLIWLETPVDAISSAAVPVADASDQPV